MEKNTSENSLENRLLNLKKLTNGTIEKLEFALKAIEGENANKSENFDAKIKEIKDDLEKLEQSKVSRVELSDFLCDKADNDVVRKKVSIEQFDYCTQQRDDID